MMKTGTLLAAILLTLVALGHLLRVLTHAEITLNGDLVPQWVSVLGTLIPGTIAWLLWRGK